MLNPAKKETPAQESIITENKKNESEEHKMPNYSEFMYACESYMDELMLELNTDSAMEAEGAEGEGSSAASIGAKLKSGFAKLKSAVKRGDKKAAEEANKEIKAEAEKLTSASDEAGKKKMSAAGKVGVAAAAAVATAVGLAYVGQKLQTKAHDEGEDPSKVKDAIIKASNAIMKVATKNIGTMIAYQGAAAASGAVLGRQVGKKIAAKQAAKKAADKAAEAFGLESYSLYEIIMEAFDEIEDTATESLEEFDKRIAAEI